MSVPVSNEKLPLKIRNMYKSSRLPTSGSNNQKTKLKLNSIWATIPENDSWGKHKFSDLGAQNPRKTLRLFTRDLTSINSLFNSQTIDQVNIGLFEVIKPKAHLAQ